MTSATACIPCVVGPQLIGGLVPNSRVFGGMTMDELKTYAAATNTAFVGTVSVYVNEKTPPFTTAISKVLSQLSALRSDSTRVHL